MITRFTPEKISKLASNEIFVFGSNLAGMHGGGAARAAVRHFGAIMGQGVGLQGQSYAIPTMQGGVDTIRPYVDEFILFAHHHPELTFIVTRIGCGIAGFHDADIAPLFANALMMDNVVLPLSFVKILMPWTSEAAISNNKKVTWDDTAFCKMKDKMDYEGLRELRIVEYYNTIDFVKQGYYYVEGQRVNIPQVGSSQFYDAPIAIGPASAAYDTQICVENNDCLEEALLLIRHGYHPAVLNLADRHIPGGCVLQGSGAQEESIFRRTNLYTSLYQFHDMAQYFGVPRANKSYPMDRHHGGIYSKDVTVFRHTEDCGYRLMDHPYQIDIITVAALAMPPVMPDGTLGANDTQTTLDKMRTIMRLGLNGGNDALVLGAFGCGAFRNPPRFIATLFSQVINEPEFVGKYKRIHFAIFDNHAAFANSKEGNYKAFRDVLLGDISPIL
ncbi:MAG: TIGR02452 family protein [Bacteroidales bacterium]|nr:TIGR02452 family protein [Bacteroidales bacterium]